MTSPIVDLLARTRWGTGFLPMAQGTGAHRRPGTLLPEPLEPSLGLSAHAAGGLWFPRSCFVCPEETHK